MSDLQTQLRKSNRLFYYLYDFLPFNPRFGGCRPSSKLSREKIDLCQCLVQLLCCTFYSQQVVKKLNKYKKLGLLKLNDIQLSMLGDPQTSLFKVILLKGNINAKPTIPFLISPRGRPFFWLLLDSLEATLPHWPDLEQIFAHSLFCACSLGLEKHNSLNFILLLSFKTKITLFTESVRKLQPQHLSY